MLKVIGVPRTLPAATLALSLAMKSARAGGHVFGIATPFAPMPVPALMLNTGTSVGSMSVVAPAAGPALAVGLAIAAEVLVECLGRAEALNMRRERRVVVVRSCIVGIQVDDWCLEDWQLVCCGEKYIHREVKEQSQLQ